MSNADAIPWDRLHLRDPEDVPTQTGLFEISGSASSEVVDSRVYTRFPDREEKLQFAQLFCGLMQSLGREQLDYAAIAEQISLEEYERQLRVSSSNSNRIDILLCDCEAESAIIIENKILHSTMNEFPSHWNHVTYPRDQKLGVLFSLHPTEVLSAVKSRFKTITQLGWIDAVQFEGVQIRIPLHTHSMITSFANAINDRSTDVRTTDRARFYSDHHAQMSLARVCICRLTEIDHIKPQITSGLKRRIVFWGNGTLGLQGEDYTLRCMRSLIAPQSVMLTHRVATGLSRRRVGLAQGHMESTVPSVSSGAALAVKMSLMRLVDTTLRMSARFRELASGPPASCQRCMIEAVTVGANGPLCREPQDVHTEKVRYAIDSGDATTSRARSIEIEHCANESEALTNNDQENRTALDTSNPWAWSIVHICSDQVSEPRNLRCLNWSAPRFNAARLVSDLPELLAREGASR